MAMENVKQEEKEGKSKNRGIYKKHNGPERTLRISTPNNDNKDNRKQRDLVGQVERE